jgi:two-component system cell cycle response regulator DivK
MAKILVVEDSDDMRLMMRDLLNTLGHEVVEALDGLDGVTAALRTRPALVILDLMMPTAPGASFLDFKRTTPGLEHLVVIVISAHSEIEDIARGYGADAWMAKPVRIQDLSKLIESLLARRAP